MFVWSWFVFWTTGFRKGFFTSFRYNNGFSKGGEGSFRRSSKCFGSSRGRYGDGLFSANGGG